MTPIHVNDLKDYKFSQEIAGCYNSSLCVSLRCEVSPYNGTFRFSLWKDHKQIYCPQASLNLEKALEEFNKLIEQDQSKFAPTKKQVCERDGVFLPNRMMRPKTTPKTKKMKKKRKLA